jgi:predicted nucleic acid binding AN1-type Zn finger protein
MRGQGMLYITTMAKRSITGAYYSAKCLRIKVETAEGCDEGTGNAVHHHHGEEEHHTRVLLT